MNQSVEWNVIRVLNVARMVVLIGSCGRMAGAYKPRIWWPTCRRLGWNRYGDDDQLWQNDDYPPGTSFVDACWRELLRKAANIHCWKCSWEWLSKQTSLLKINCFLDGLGSSGQDGMRPFLGIVMIVRVGGANLFRMQTFKLTLGPFTWIVGHVEKASGVDFRFYRFLLWKGFRCKRYLV